MRIISSDGMKSVEFEKYALIVHEYYEGDCTIKAHYMDDEIVMSDFYTDIEDAKYEFDRIHEAYICSQHIYRIQRIHNKQEDANDA